MRVGSERIGGLLMSRDGGWRYASWLFYPFSSYECSACEKEEGVSE